MTVLANDPKRTTNAQAIADLAELGILRPDDSIIDLTVGPKCGFWQLWQPDRDLFTNDLDHSVAATTHRDVLRDEWQADSFDVAVWDGPYGYRGTPSEFDEAYGTTRYRTANAIDELIVGGALVAMDIAKRIALVKCQDQNVASSFRDQSGFVTEAVRAKGGRVAGKLYIQARRGQPAGKKQLNIWGYHSVLLVIEVP